MSTVGGIQVVGDQTLGKAISSINLKVPVNQRSYKWEKEHVLDLFQDLGAAIASDDSEYFLGSIVLTEGKYGERPQVVDGQQRLATTMILLAAIRDYFETHGDKNRADDIRGEYLVKRDIDTQEWAPKFILNEGDSDYFRRRVLLSNADSDRLPPLASSDKAPASHCRIDAAAVLAAKYVADVVKPYADKEKTETLLKWIRFIREGARVIWVTVPDEANAFVMFETLNDRGLELSKADLLKNYLLGRSQDRIGDVQTRWSNMVGALDTVGDESLVVTYIRHWWSSQYGPTRDRELYTAIRSKIKSKQAAVDLAAELAANANVYAAILTPSHEFWNEHEPSAPRHIATLRQLEMEQVRPLLLAIVKKLPKAEAVKCLRLLVNCSVRFLIVGGLGGGRMEKAYAERAINVRSGTIRTATQLLASLRSVVPNDKVFEDEFGHARVSKSALARYYLRALQQKSDGERHPEYVPNDDQAAITREHIMPLSLSSHWRVDKDMHAQCVKRLGNMALLRKDENSLVGDEKFSAKRKVFSASGLSLTKEVAAYSGWDAVEIAARQERLAKLAVETWPLKT